MKSSLIDDALTGGHLVISVMGEHAGENVDAIFDRKMADIDRVGKTFWLMKSPKAQPTIVQEMCRGSSAHVVFVAPASSGGARPTVLNDRATKYSQDGLEWHGLPQGLSPVTGNLHSRATALVFDELTTCKGLTLDMWDFAEFVEPQQPIRFILGCSTVCAIRKDMRAHPKKLASRHRQILAVGQLTSPYCVWVR